MLSSPINWITEPTSRSSPSHPITHWRLKYSLGFMVSMGASAAPNCSQ